MRSIDRQEQAVYFSSVTEKLDEIDTIKVYSKPELRHMTVSSTSGTPEEIAAGLVPNYDRYLTRWKNRWDSFEPQEGMLLWIDVEPELNEDGSLKIDEETSEPTVLPDYRLKKYIGTAKGLIRRYGIEKIGANYEENQG